MDTFLTNGDFARNDCGRPYEVDGFQELLQRAKIRLSVRQGSFQYDTKLGSRLYTLKNVSGDTERRALPLVWEALSALPSLGVNKVACTQDGQGGLQVLVGLAAGGQSGEVSIFI